MSLERKVRVNHSQYTSQISGLKAQVQCGQDGRPPRGITLLCIIYKDTETTDGRRPGQDVKLSEEEGGSGVAGRARPSALQNFGKFPDSGVAYAPRRPKIARYLSTKEILHIGMASQKPKLGGRRGRGVKLLIKLFSQEVF